jgi:hypothetical protein
VVERGDVDELVAEVHVEELADLDDVRTAWKRWRERASGARIGG